MFNVQCAMLSVLSHFTRPKVYDHEASMARAMEAEEEEKQRKRASKKRRKLEAKQEKAKADGYELIGCTPPPPYT